MFKSDCFIKIFFNTNHPKQSKVETDVSKDYLEEVLGGWISGQFGEGEDNSVSNNKQFYEIIIELDLTCDTFRTTSDTNNKGLTLGIVTEVFSLIKKNKIEIKFI